MTTLHGFTGSGREHDDDVDALGSAYDSLAVAQASGYAAMLAARGTMA